MIGSIVIIKDIEYEIIDKHGPFVLVKNNYDCWVVNMRRGTASRLIEEQKQTILKKLNNGENIHEDFVEITKSIQQ